MKIQMDEMCTISSIYTFTFSIFYSFCRILLDETDSLSTSKINLLSNFQYQRLLILLQEHVSKNIIHAGAWP
jgi:hypothetical protein